MMDIPIEIPPIYQPIWEGAFNTAIGEGVTESDAVKKAWDALELLVYEAQGAYHPSIVYNKKNREEIIDDININRATITYSQMTPEDVLKLYKIPTTAKDYAIIYKWLEEHIYQARQEVMSNKITINRTKPTI